MGDSHRPVTPSHVFGEADDASASYRQRRSELGDTYIWHIAHCRRFVGSDRRAQLVVNSPIDCMSPPGGKARLSPSQRIRPIPDLAGSLYGEERDQPSVTNTQDVCASQASISPTAPAPDGFRWGGNQIAFSERRFIASYTSPEPPDQRMI